MTDWRQAISGLPNLSPQFKLEPARTALLIIDMQYLDAHPDYNFGAFIQRKFPEFGRYYFERLRSLVIPNHVRLLKFFREKGMRVVYITVGPILPDNSDLSPFIRSESRDSSGRVRYKSWFSPVGSYEHHILEELKPQPGELVVNKTTAGAFNSTTLETTLKHMGIEGLVITGVATHACVETTARDAADRGFKCVLVEDAVADFIPLLHDNTLQVFALMFGPVLTTDAVLARLAGQA